VQARLVVKREKTKTAGTDGVDGTTGDSYRDGDGRM
jgi:hypothetical protein